MCPIQIAQGRLLLRQNFRLAIRESFRGQMERLSSHCSLTVLFAWTNNPTNGCCSTTGTFRQFRRSNLNFVVVIAVCCCFVWRNLDRVQNYFESTDAVAILNDKIRNEKKNCDCLWTNIGNGGGNSSCLPPAKLELRKWNGDFCSNRLEGKKWNTSEGRPFVPENFRSNQKFCLNGKRPRSCWRALQSLSEWIER